jgi:hypothetical protein
MAYSETAIRHVDDEKRVQPFPGQMLMTFLLVAFEHLHQIHMNLA